MRHAARVAAHFKYWTAEGLQSDGVAAAGCATMRMPRSLGVAGGRLRPTAPLAGLPWLPLSCPLSSPSAGTVPAAPTSHCWLRRPVSWSQEVLTYDGQPSWHRRVHRMCNIAMGGAARPHACVVRCDEAACCREWHAGPLHWCLSIPWATSDTMHASNSEVLARYEQEGQ
jgi:hypothetical protein